MGTIADSSRASRVFPVRFGRLFERSGSKKGPHRICFQSAGTLGPSECFQTEVSADSGSFDRISGSDSGPDQRQNGPLSPTLTDMVRIQPGQAPQDRGNLIPNARTRNHQIRCPENEPFHCTLGAFCSAILPASAWTVRERQQQKIPILKNAKYTSQKP